MKKFILLLLILILIPFSISQDNQQTTIEANQLQIVVLDVEDDGYCDLSYLKSTTSNTTKQILLRNGIYIDKNLKSWFKLSIQNQTLTINCKKYLYASDIIASLINKQGTKLIIQEKHSIDQVIVFDQSIIIPTSDADGDGIPNDQDQCPIDACPESDPECCLGCPSQCGNTCAEKECTDTGWLCTPNDLNCPSESCSTNPYCEEDNYCIPPSNQKTCSLDDNGLYGFCVDSQCPTSGFDPNYCSQNQGCVSDADRDNIPNILDCNDISPSIGQCTGCATCSVDPTGNFDEGVCRTGSCSQTICQDGCDQQAPSENFITYKKASLSNSCSLNGDDGTCTDNQCEIKTSIYSEQCDPDDDDDGICDSAYPFDGVCTEGPDLCPYTPPNTLVDPITGCSDSDDDGIPDNDDVCPYTFPNCPIEDNGCALDDDNDGICNSLDNCLNTELNCEVNKDPDSFNLGCPIDDDDDNICDGIDFCPNTPFGCDVDFEGCPDSSDPSCALDCNSCEQAENSEDCSSCGGPCYWSEYVFIGECSFCTTNTECSDYESSDTCRNDDCSVQDCSWIDSECCEDVNNDGYCDTEPLVTTTECVSDSDCFTNEECINNECKSSGSGETEVECTSDDECGFTEECRNDRCVSIPQTEEKGFPWWILIVLLVLGGVVFFLYKKGILKFKKKPKKQQFAYKKPLDVFRKPLAKPTSLRKQIPLRKPKPFKPLTPSFKAPIVLPTSKKPSETMNKLGKAFENLEKSFKKKPKRKKRKTTKKKTKKK